MSKEESKTLILNKVRQYLSEMLGSRPDFTGKVELNFQDGVLKDINETRRTKV